jgi:hypothetical protein
MSKRNKVNKDRYVQRGRLTPDDLARERQKPRRTGVQPASNRTRSTKFKTSP